MADTDNRKQNSEEVVGAGHATKDDVANRHMLAQHDNYGRHLWKQGTDIASASTIAIPDNSVFCDVTGTTDITVISAKSTGCTVVLKFDSALTILHTASTLEMPNGGDLKVIAGDTIMMHEYESGKWRCLNHSRAGIAPARKGAIINGDFNIWQRGASFTGIGTAYSTDRFRGGVSGDGVVDHIRSTDVPTQAQSGHKSNYSLHIDVTTADVSVGTTSRYLLTQFIEGSNYAPFEGNPGTLSFWVKGTKTGIHCVAFRNSGSDRSYVAEYTINAADTWEKKIIPITFDYVGGTWNYTNGTGLDISWALAAGSSFHGVANTWNSSNDLATANQVNVMDNVANNFRIAQVQFELGSSATDFEYRDIATEQDMCERYYEKSYNTDIAPGAASTTGKIAYSPESSYTGWLRTSATFRTIKRTTPTVTLYSTTGAGGNVRLNGTSDLVASAEHPGASGYALSINRAWSAGDYIWWHHTADSEL